MTRSLLRAEGLKVVRNGRVLLDVDHFSVHESEIVTLVGPNGAGKSTLIQILGLLLRPDQGTVFMDQEPVTPKRERAARKRLACVFQAPLLLDKTVRANVELGLRLRGFPKKERRTRTTHWIDLLGLSEIQNQRTSLLSGGEAQRVNLARALVLQPDILFLDEPLGALDPPTRQAMLDEIGPLIRRGTLGAVKVTHDRSEAFAMGDRVAVMIDSRIRQFGPPEEVFACPVDLEVARFVGVENLLPAKAAGNEVHIATDCVLKCRKGQEGDITACLRAEEVRLLATGRENGEYNRLSGRVRSISPRGDGFIVEVDVGRVLQSRITRADLAALSLELGQKVPILIRTNAIHRVSS